MVLFAESKSERVSNIWLTVYTTVYVLYRDYSLSGSYRKVVVKPQHLSWELMYYDDYQLPLIQGDTDIINNQPLPCLLYTSDAADE